MKRLALVIGLMAVLGCTEDGPENVPDMSTPTDMSSPTDSGSPAADIGRDVDLGPTDVDMGSTDVDMGMGPRCSGTPSACDVFPSQGDCVVRPGCTWDGTACSGTQTVPCENYSSTPPCQAAGCSWSGNAVCESGGSECNPSEVCCPGANPGEFVCEPICRIVTSD